MLFIIDLLVNWRVLRFRRRYRYFFRLFRQFRIVIDDIACFIRYLRSSVSSVYFIDNVFLKIGSIFNFCIEN